MTVPLVALPPGSSHRVKPGTLAHALQLAFDLRPGDVPRATRACRVTGAYAALRCLDTTDVRAFLGTDLMTYLEAEGYTRTRRGQIRLTRQGVEVLVRAGFPARPTLALSRAS
ncbi:hypothetical protein [Deinococcus enclensis]|uniref:Uncharacterized protein n=1 Tax=Deinococcus enclensis TaxID=1049582 RepID=A0ABT9MFR4_9DEIO|nr:hypothetical protein [Deinococcus enclensis]MDP9765440.1 hypothetical protein [Deinococcus enclensis]